MKRWMLLGLLLAGLFNAALAQTNTPGGTVISNTATATFTDSNLVDRNTTSNTVTTTVQTVFSFNIEPDNGLAPTLTTDFGGSLPGHTQNVATGAIGATVTFNYTITNNTNGPINLSLSVLQDTADNFNLDNVQVSIDGGSTWQNFVVGTPIALTLAAQNAAADVRVRGTIPSGVNGNQVALIDLVATNNTAVTAGQTGANISFESNNIARTTVGEIPVIGLAKAATSAVDATGFPGQFLTTITMTIRNYGNVPLSNVQITDDLAATFPSPATFAVSSAPTSATLTVNPTFTGIPGPGANLLAGTDTLAIGATATVSFTVRFNPGAAATPFTNTATATATSPAGVDVSDNSTNGTEPDPNGDGNPNEAVPTPLDALRLVKSVRTCFEAACTTVLSSTGVTVAPGQYLEYTITVTSFGNLTNVVVTDPIPTNTFYVLGSIRGPAGATLQCLTNLTGAIYEACPAVATIPTPYPDVNNTVTHVRWSVGAMNSTTNTLTFVVRVR